MAMIKFDHVDKYYGKFHALKTYQSRIRERRSCRCHWSFWFRKSTMLRCINGLETISSGRLLINDMTCMIKNKT